jgi:hypothetical protein
MGMRMRAAFILLCAAFTAVGVLLARGRSRNTTAASTTIPLPDDYQQKTEWTRARLTCGNPAGTAEDVADEGIPDRVGAPTTRARIATSSGRQASHESTRARRTGSRPDGTDDIYNWPMLYAVEVGHWSLRRAGQAFAIFWIAAASSLSTISTERLNGKFSESFKKFSDRPSILKIPIRSSQHLRFGKAANPGMQWFQRT